MKIEEPKSSQSKEEPLMSAEDKIHLLNAAETYKVIALSNAHISKEDAAADSAPVARVAAGWHSSYC